MNTGDERALQSDTVTCQDAVAAKNVDYQQRAEQTSEQVHVAPFAELVVGANLTFDFTTASATIAVKAIIAHVYQPFTMSAVLRV